MSTIMGCVSRPRGSHLHLLAHPTQPTPASMRKNGTASSHSKVNTQAGKDGYYISTRQISLQKLPNPRKTKSLTNDDQGSSTTTPFASRPPTTTACACCPSGPGDAVTALASPFSPTTFPPILAPPNPFPLPLRFTPILPPILMLPFPPILPLPLPPTLPPPPPGR
jgi:hypothetical protein